MLMARGIHASPVAAKVLKLDDSSIPLPPKSPPSSYALFFVDFVSKHKDEFRTEEGKVRTSDIAKEAGRQWNELGDGQQPYIDKAKSLGSEYKQAYETYYNSLDPTQLKIINAHLARPLPVPESHPDSKRGTSASRRIAREKRGEPPKGTTGFFAFLNEFRHSDEFKKQCEDEGVKGAALVVFASKLAGRKWGVMSPEEKQAYADKAAAQREAHKAWKEQQGHA